MVADHARGPDSRPRVCHGRRRVFNEKLRWIGGGLCRGCEPSGSRAGAAPPHRRSLLAARTRQIPCHKARPHTPKCRRQDRARPPQSCGRGGHGRMVAWLTDPQAARLPDLGNRGDLRRLALGLLWLRRRTFTSMSTAAPIGASRRGLWLRRAQAWFPPGIKPFASSSVAIALFRGRRLLAVLRRLRWAGGLTLRPISLRRRRMALLRLRSGLSAQARGVPGGCLLRGPWRRRSGLTRGARALLSRRVPLSAVLRPGPLLELLRVALLPLLR